MSEAKDKLMTAAREVATDAAMPEKARAVARALVSVVPLLEQAEHAASEAIRERDGERLNMLAWLETERSRWDREVGEVFDRIADQISSGAHVGTVKDTNVVRNDTDEPRTVTWTGTWLGPHRVG